MSREIKFRGWNDGKNWNGNPALWEYYKPRMTYYKHWFTLHAQSVLCFEESEGHSYVDESDVDWPKRVVLMQYTGLKDKKDKEIYEKDYDDEGLMIDFCNECSGYQVFQIDIPTKDIIFCNNCCGNFTLQDHLPDFEIAGNLYEPQTEI